MQGRTWWQCLQGGEGGAAEVRPVHAGQRTRCSARALPRISSTATDQRTGQLCADACPALPHHRWAHHAAAAAPLSCDSFYTLVVLQQAIPSTLRVKLAEYTATQQHPVHVLSDAAGAVLRRSAMPNLASYGQQHASGSPAAGSNAMQTTPAACLPDEQGATGTADMHRVLRLQACDRIVIVSGISPMTNVALAA